MWIFPSREIHLVRNAQPNTVSLRVFVQEPANRKGAWTDASTSTHTVELDPVPASGTPPSMPTLNGTAGAAPSSVVVTPNDNGQWIVRTKWTFHELSDPTSPLDFDSHGVMRVTVHDDISALFSGDRLISMWSGESDRQLTVFARFTDNAFEDITAHPYLKYRVEPPTLATVDPVEGRITALTDGIGSVFVSTWDGRFEFQVGLAVASPLNAGGVPATVEQLRPRTTKHRSTLWVFAEGYQDRARFLKHAHQSVDQWLRTEPYKHLADQFAAFGVFLSSPDRQITIGSPVTSVQLSDPRSIWEGQGFSQTTPTVPPERMVNRNTIYGLMLGSRLSTPLVRDNRDPVDPPFTELFTPASAARVAQPDPRRLGPWAVDPRESYVSFVTRFLAGAKQKLEPNDRILFLVDERVDVGVHFGVLGLDLALLATPRHMISIGIRHEPTFPVVAAAAGAPQLLDRDLDPSHDPRRNDFKANETGSVFAHELGHSYGLGDEYENRNRVNAANTLSSLVAAIEEDDNLHADLVLRSNRTRPLRTAPPANNVNVDKIKWNVHRIKKASFVTRLVTQPATGNTSTLVLTVARDQVRRWAVGEQVFIRNTVEFRPNPFAPQRRFTSIAATVAAIDPQHDTVRISIPQMAVADVPKQLGTTPLLYTPQRNKAGRELGLIDPVVLDWIKANGPFPKPTQCGVASDKDDDDVDCPSIFGFSRPSVHAQAIGLYEGGKDISCGVYRPCGRCRMRNQDARVWVVDDPNKEVIDLNAPLGRRKKGHWATVIIELCFVCRYMLIDRLDPSQHEWLDTTYPKDC